MVVLCPPVLRDDERHHEALWIKRERELRDWTPARLASEVAQATGERVSASSVKQAEAKRPDKGPSRRIVELVARTFGSTPPPAPERRTVTAEDLMGMVAALLDGNRLDRDLLKAQADAMVALATELGGLRLLEEKRGSKPRSPSSGTQRG